MTDEALSTKWTTKPERLVELADMVLETPWAEGCGNVNIKHDWKKHKRDAPFEAGVMFNMRTFMTRMPFGDCRTACCLAGLAVMAWTKDVPREKLHGLRLDFSDPHSIPSRAARHLGLEDAVACRLFLCGHPDGWADDFALNNGIRVGDIQPKQAAEALRRVAHGHEPREAWEHVLLKKGPRQHQAEEVR